MKKQIQKFIKAHGGVSNYSGKEKTMYISTPTYNSVYHPSPELIETAVVDHFGFGIPFRLTTTN